MKALEFIEAHSTAIVLVVYLLASMFAKIFPSAWLSAFVFDADRFTQALLGIRFNVSDVLKYIGNIDKAHAEAYIKAQDAIKQANKLLERLDSKKTQQIPVGTLVCIDVPVDTQDAPVITTTDVTP